MNGVTSAWRRDSDRRSARSHQGCGYWTLPGTGELLPADPQASTNLYNRPWLNRYLQWQAEQAELTDEAIAMSDATDPNNAS